MLAPADFAAKTMLLYATVMAFDAGEITKVDWTLTDHGLIQRFLNSGSDKVKDTVKRWLTGQLWDFSPLFWMEGNRPPYERVKVFSEELSEHLGRTCWAYAIKDKRDRALMLRFDDGTQKQVGNDAHRWLLGAGSSVRRPFGRKENDALVGLAVGFFKTRVLETSVGSPGKSGADVQPWLI
jgi:hypothetical protein